MHPELDKFNNEVDELTLQHVLTLTQAKRLKELAEEVRQEGYDKGNDEGYDSGRHHEDNYAL